MSRDVKFRAWVKDRKAIFEVILIDYVSKKVTYIVERIGHLLNIRHDKFNDIELMQYSGLTDMMEKEIYEGDILFESSEEKYLKVVFEDGSFSLDSEEYSLPLKEYAHICKIVGNIYESPELLRKIE